MVRIIINEADMDGTTALIAAAAGGHTECARLLMNHGANKDAADNRGLTALMAAASNGRSDCVRLLTEFGADKEAVHSNGTTALFYAARDGHTDCVCLLVHCGANPNTRIARSGFTALMGAARNGHKEIVRMLIISGADTEATDLYGTTALSKAISQNNIDCVRLLAEAGGTGQNSASDSRSAALIECARHGRIDFLRLLLDAGIDKNSKDVRGCSALSNAAASGYTNCARLLLDSGADMDSEYNEGITALANAVRYSHAGIARMLITRGANKGLYLGFHAGALYPSNTEIVELIASSASAHFDEMDMKTRSRFMGRSCYNCFETKAIMQKCGSCVRTRYCCKECQLAHWPEHKVTCDRRGKAAFSPARDEFDAVAQSYQSPRSLSDSNASPTLPVVQDTCNFCHAKKAHGAERLRQCARCRDVSYCSEICQRGDWSAHKKACAKPARRGE
jgi:ankyrin repeat protein